MPDLLCGQDYQRVGDNTTEKIDASLKIDMLQKVESGS